MTTLDVETANQLHASDPIRSTESAADLLYQRNISDISSPLARIDRNDVHDSQGRILREIYLVDEDGEMLDTTSPDHIYPSDIAFMFDHERSEDDFFILTNLPAEAQRELKSLAKQYRETVIKISQAKERMAGPERQLLIQENLELQRQRIHNQAAELIRSTLSIWGDINMVQNADKKRDAARNLFDAYYYMYEMDEPGKLKYSGEAIYEDKIAEMVAQVKQQYGVDVEVVPYDEGTHAGRRKYSYFISFSGVNSHDEAVVRNFIHQMLSR